MGCAAAKEKPEKVYFKLKVGTEKERVAYCIEKSCSLIRKDT